MRHEVMRAALAVALGVGLVAPAVAAKDLASVPGFVDGNVLLECAGEEALTVEVRLSGALLRMACSFEPELCEAIRGVEMIHAVILDVSDLPASARACLRDEVLATDKRLTRKGWERLALVKEDDEEVRVLVLTGETTIDGLVVTMVGRDEVVFTNIAGPFDMAAFQRLVEDSDLPGLSDIDFGELSDAGKREKGDR